MTRTVGVAAAALVVVLAGVAIAVAWSWYDDAGDEGALVGPTSTGAPSAGATSTSTSGTSTAVDAACAGTLRADELGALADPALDEVSGIEGGVANPDVLWAHNDSGDSARVFALSRAGATRREFTLPGVVAVDWEDLAIGAGPTPGVPYLYLGDIGDNTRSRDEVVVHRAPEPAVTDGPPVALEGVEPLRLRYPDGAHDAEALLVDPETGAIHVIEKAPEGGAARVYRAPGDLAGGSATTMELVASIELPSGLTGLVTGADLSADGRQLAVRTYGGISLWPRAPGASIADALVTSACRGPMPFEFQGEAIAFDPDGRGYVTVAEGSGAVLHHFAA